MIQAKANKFLSVSYQRFSAWQSKSKYYQLKGKFLLLRYAILSKTTIIYYNKMIDINEITYAGVKYIFGKIAIAREKWMNIQLQLW